MLNKKTLFNTVYAIAIISVISACFGFLNELVNHSQLYGVEIKDVYTFKGNDFWIPFAFYLAAFIICSVTTILIILHATGVKKQNYINIYIALGCVILLILSIVIIYMFSRYSAAYKVARLDYFDYMSIYTLRSGVMSFIASSCIIWVCNIIEKKACKNNVISESAALADEKSAD